jgi:hypothetical protein
MLPFVFELYSARYLFSSLFYQTILAVTTLETLLIRHLRIVLCIFELKKRILVKKELTVGTSVKLWERVKNLYNCKVGYLSVYLPS